MPEYTICMGAPVAATGRPDIRAVRAIYVREMPAVAREVWNERNSCTFSRTNVFFKNFSYIVNLILEYLPFIESCYRILCEIKYSRLITSIWFIYYSRYTHKQTERKEVETHSEDDDENVRKNRMHHEEVRRRVGPVPHLQSPYSNSSEGDVSDDSDTSLTFSPLTPLLTSNQKKRSGALQRQQLLEIIQANMEKNFGFQTTRFVSFVTLLVL